MSKMDFLNDDVIVLDSSVLQIFQKKSMEYHKEESWDDPKVFSFSPCSTDVSTGQKKRFVPVHSTAYWIRLKRYPAVKPYSFFTLGGIIISHCLKVKYFFHGIPAIVFPPQAPIFQTAGSGPPHPHPSTSSSFVWHHFSGGFFIFRLQDVSEI